MHKLHELKIWQKSMEMCEKVYTLTAMLPESETYGLISQMRRAAVSVSSNISEGAGRNSQKEFVRFLAIANGSCYELETQVHLSLRLGFIDSTISETLLGVITEVQKMNYVLQQSLSNQYVSEPEIHYENTHNTHET